MTTAKWDATHLTPDELGKRWSLSGRTLQDMRTKGTGPAYIKMSKKVVLYPVAAVEEYEAARLVTHTAAP